MKTTPLECFLCSGPAILYPTAAAELRIDCAACLEYAITWGAANKLKGNPVAAVTARAYVTSRHEAGESRPVITAEMIGA
jgi:hypothetical protein